MRTETPERWFWVWESNKARKGLERGYEDTGKRLEENHLGNKYTPHSCWFLPTYRVGGGFYTALPPPSQTFSLGLQSLPVS